MPHKELYDYNKNTNKNIILTCESRGFPKDPCKNKGDEVYLHLSDVDEWKNKCVQVRILNWNIINNIQKGEFNHKQWRLFLDRKILTECIYTKYFSSVIDVNEYIILSKEEAENNYILDEELYNLNGIYNYAKQI